MERVTSQDGESANLVNENIEQLKSLLPEAFGEGGVNFDTLRQLLGDAGGIDEGEEKYGLNWHGKKKARQIALTPSIGTLRPCPGESVTWDTTQNLFIEGDNLEVLKLLQKSYAGKVKMIYIDPPYNTGKDFVYPDNFQNNIKNYLELTGQAEDGQKISSNTEASGRFHTDWLNMMYPRLKLAKGLLRSDGLIFVSCDDNELPRLRMVMDEIFGEDRHLATFVWKSRQNKDNRTVNGASVDHEYMVCFGETIRGDARDESQFSNSDNDPRGAWTSANMVGIATVDRRPNLHYVLVNPVTGIEYPCSEMGWRYDRNTMARLIEEDRIIWPSSPTGRPRRKAFLNDFESSYTGFSTIIGANIYTRHGTAVIDDLFGTRVFDFPKPVGLLESIIEQGSLDGDIVLDFFAGSGTTAHAVMKQNLSDGCSRRFILVQLPEPLKSENREQKTAADFCEKIGKPKNIAELTKERLRRTSVQINSTTPTFRGDVGFRVFKLDNSNIKVWNPDRTDLEETLLSHQEHLIEGRSELDVLYELLLKRGIDLAAPIEEKEFSGKKVYSIGYGALFACLDESLPQASIESVAQGILTWHEELKPASDTHVFFRDSAFSDDVTKTNMAAILEQNGISHVRSL